MSLKKEIIEYMLLFVCINDIRIGILKNLDKISNKNAKKIIDAIVTYYTGTKKQVVYAKKELKKYKIKLIGNKEK